MIHRYTLDNQMQVAVHHLPTVETFSLALSVPVGARYETPQESGLSHMLEHMFFKGTPSRTALQIAEEAENRGAHLNAYTSKENTVFTVRALQEDFEALFELLADILCNSTFNDAELARERDVVLQEIAMTHDTPDDCIFDYFQEVAYPDQPMGQSILGTIENVSNFTSQDMHRFKAKYYNPAGMILGVAGKVDPELVLKLSQKYFQQLPVLSTFTPQDATFQAGEKAITRDLEQIHMLMGTQGMPLGHEHYFDISLLATILGGGMASRLFQEVREKRGLVYSIFAFHSAYKDTGTFGIHASMTPEKYEAVCQAVQEELARFPETVRADELARAKQQLKASLMMRQESVSGQCEQLVHQIRTYGRPLTPAEILDKINAVTLEGLSTLSTKLFRAPMAHVRLGK